MFVLIFATGTLITQFMVSKFCGLRAHTYFFFKRRQLEFDEWKDHSVSTALHKRHLHEIEHTIIFIYSFFSQASRADVFSKCLFLTLFFGSVKECY